jgi:hypothetical protein
MQLRCVESLQEHKHFIHQKTYTHLAIAVSNRHVVLLSIHIMIVVNCTVNTFFRTLSLYAYLNKILEVVCSLPPFWRDVVHLEGPGVTASAAYWNNQIVVPTQWKMSHRQVSIDRSNCTAFTVALTFTHSLLITPTHCDSSGALRKKFFKVSK